MHRVLVIRLGEALSDPLQRIEREYRAREHGGVLDAVRVAFVDAPPRAVGNLSNPVEVLREKLEEQLLGATTDLLRLSSGAEGDLILDVFLLLNFGEPLVANAAAVVIDILDRIIDENFRAIFPAHRTGPARRFRIVPIAILPAAGDCEKSRDEAVDELATLHDDFVARRDGGETEFPVDRLFLLDAVTGRGIAALHDLVDQVYGFLRLALFSGLRRSTDVVSLFESECSDLFASFGVATCEVDFLRVRDTLAARMARRTAEALAAPGSCALPPVTDLLPSPVLDDAERRDRALRELDALPVRTLEADGSRAIRPLLALYDELAERLETWRETAETAPSSPNTPAGTDASSGSPSGLGWAFVGALLLGGAVFAVAHFALVISTTLSAVTGGGFAAAAFAALFLLLRKPASDKPEDDTPVTQSEQIPNEALDALASRVDARRSSLRGLSTSLERISRSFALDAPVPAVSAPRRMFLEPLVSDALLKHLYEGQASDVDIRSLADRFLISIGEWNELLTGAVRADAAGLDAFCAEHFRELGGQPLFADAETRECIHGVLESFVKRWREGLPISLEGEAHKQFDRDGFYRVFDSTVLVSEDLAADVGACIRRTDAVLDTSRRASALDDIFIITAVADIHPDAVAPLRNRRSP